MFSRRSARGRTIHVVAKLIECSQSDVRYWHLADIAA